MYNMDSNKKKDTTRITAEADGENYQRVISLIEGSSKRSSSSSLSVGCDNANYNKDTNNHNFDDTDLIDSN